MKNNEKSLMEEILGRKKDNSKNELLDNDDTLLNSTVHSLPKTEKLQNNYSQNSETNKNNNKVKNLNNTGKLEKVKKIKEKEIKKDKINIKKIFSKKEVPESEKEIKRKANKSRIHYCSFAGCPTLLRSFWKYYLPKCFIPFYFFIGTVYR